MTARRWAFVTVTLAAVAAAATFALGASAHLTKGTPRLVGIVGQNNTYKITVTSARGVPLKTVAAGTYVFDIRDDSARHSYMLAGPQGKTWTFTTVRFTGQKLLALKLTPGKYTAYCRMHKAQMHVSFTVK